MYLCCHFPEAVAIHCFIGINKCHRYNRNFGIHRALKYTCFKILKGILIVTILTLREKQIYFPSLSSLVTVIMVFICCLASLRLMPCPLP